MFKSEVIKESFEQVTARLVLEQATELSVRVALLDLLVAINESSKSIELHHSHKTGESDFYIKLSPIEDATVHAINALDTGR